MRRLLAVSPTGLVSGAEVVLLRVLGAARDAGWKISCLSPGGPLTERLDAAGAHHEVLPDLKLPAGPAPLAVTYLAARTVRAAATIRRAARSADVVLVNGLLALPALRLAGVRAPAAWLVHDVIHRRSWIRVLRASRRAVRLAVAVSESVAAPLVEQGVATRVVRNGTPWPVEPMPDRPDRPPVVGCTALLTSWKGQDVLLEAVSRLDRDDVMVELVGGRFPKDGPYVESLRRRAAQADLSGRVRFVGQVADPLERMRGWTVAVSPSTEPEAGPLAPLEAMSIGLPMVGTEHGGTPEVLGDAGLLVPPRDPASLSAAIERLLGDEALWQSCHRAGPAQVAAGLTLGHQLGALVSLLEELSTTV